MLNLDIRISNPNEQQTMSVHQIYYNKDKGKMMRPVRTREAYMKLRNSLRQQSVMKAVHGGDVSQKHKLIQRAARA